ncbi:MAG: metallophosphoesterase [Bacteroidales bacterium]|nr:metallophosphoesterase [Candidatus Sodaliphilus fimicaballi]
MRLHWIPFIVGIILTILLDIVITRKLWRTGKRVGRVLAVVQEVLSVAVFGLLIANLFSIPVGKAAFVEHWAYTGKLLLAFLILSIPKWIWGLFYGVGSIKGMRSDVATVLKAAGVALGTVVFITMLQGTLITPKRYVVTEQVLEYKSLPAAFDGYTIVHISDMHLGTYVNDTSFVSRCVNYINALHPDAVCFTGDLVSMTVEEAKPFKEILARLHAHDGVYSILGNHDYADYMPRLTDDEKKADVEELIALQRSAGWIMLDNSAAVIKRGNDSIAIVGTANYGDFPFPVYGDYGKATQGLDGVFKVHMQHNPYMWRKALVGKEDAPLTLSGHTHAMQFVLHLFGLKWSPSSWRYPEWGGLYTQGEQHLYVNTGLGMVGPPMRVGVPPEITMITLKVKK